MLDWFNIHVYWAQVTVFCLLLIAPFFYYMHRRINILPCQNITSNTAQIHLGVCSKHPAERQRSVSGCVCVPHCSRLLNLNSVFMTGFVKAEHRQSHSVAPPLSTLSRSLHISPHTSLSPHKSISRSLHSKVHYSLLPAASSVCYLSLSHYLCVPPSNSPLSLHYIG